LTPSLPRVLLFCCFFPVTLSVAQEEVSNHTRAFPQVPPEGVAFFGYARCPQPSSLALSTNPVNVLPMLRSFLFVPFFVFSPNSNVFCHKFLSSTLHPPPLNGSWHGVVNVCLVFIDIPNLSFVLPPCLYVFSLSSHDAFFFAPFCFSPINPSPQQFGLIGS